MCRAGCWVVGDDQEPDRQEACPRGAFIVLERINKSKQTGSISPGCTQCALRSSGLEGPLTGGVVCRG